jgi:hypothetical protein
MIPEQGRTTLRRCLAVQLENMLLLDDRDDAPIKIADFGLSKLLTPDSVLSTMCGSPQVMGSRRPKPLRYTFGLACGSHLGSLCPKPCLPTRLWCVTGVRTPCVAAK